MQSVYDPENETRLLASGETPDLTVFAGGGYFCPPAKGQFKWHIRNYFKRHRRALKAAAKSTNVIFLGVGFGPLGNGMMARAVRAIPTQNVSLALLRDTESLEYFKDYCQASLANTCDDLAFSHLSAEAQQREHISSDDNLIGVHMGDAVADPECRNLFIKTLKELKKRNDWRYRIFIDCDNEKARASIPIIKDIVGSEYETVVFKDNLDTFLDSIKECGLVMTTKLHVGICASAMGVPVLSTPSHIKTARFYRKIDLEEAIVVSPEVSAEIAFADRSKLLASKATLTAASNDIDIVTRLLTSAVSVDPSPPFKPISELHLSEQ